MGFAEYSNYDGLALAELVKKKKVKPSDRAHRTAQSAAQRHRVQGL
jgi:hypothetical protein